jgi:hypothetical protein
MVTAGSLSMGTHRSLKLSILAVSSFNLALFVLQQLLVCSMRSSGSGSSSPHHRLQAHRQVRHVAESMAESDETWRDKSFCYFEGEAVESQGRRQGGFAIFCKLVWDLNAKYPSKVGSHRKRYVCMFASKA